MKWKKGQATQDEQGWCLSVLWCAHPGQEC